MRLYAVIISVMYCRDGQGRAFFKQGHAGSQFFKRNTGSRIAQKIGMLIKIFSWLECGSRRQIRNPRPPLLYSIQCVHFTVHTLFVLQMLPILARMCRQSVVLMSLHQAKHGNNNKLIITVHTRLCNNHNKHKFRGGKIYRY